MNESLRNSKALFAGLIVTMTLVGAANAQCCGGGAWTSGPSFLGNTPIVCPGKLPDDYFVGDKIDAPEDTSENCDVACADEILDVNSVEDSSVIPDEDSGKNPDEDSGKPPLESSGEASQDGSDNVLDDNPMESTLVEMIISPEYLAQVLGSDECVLAYTSNTPSDLYIEGTVALPSKGFIRKDGSLEPVSDLAEMLGASGISEDDTLVVCGNCLSCGDPTFVFWAMKYLGHDDIWLLEGTSEDWRLAGLPLELRTN